MSALAFLEIEKGYITEHFTIEEFSCNCGKCTPSFQDELAVRRFINRLQALRYAFDFPMIINSWHRCPAFNKEVGGADDSKHLLGIAADISTKGWTGTKRHVFVGLAFSMGFTGISAYSDFIHLDLRDDPRSMWVK